jgi:hypothetical protein
MALSLRLNPPSMFQARRMVAFRSRHTHPTVSDNDRGRVLGHLGCCVWIDKDGISSFRSTVCPAGNRCELVAWRP